MNEHLQNEAKALADASPGELPQETTFGFERQCRVMKTGTHRYAGFETKKNSKNEDEGCWKEISNFTMDLVSTERRVDTEKKMVTYTIKLTPALDKASPMEPLVTLVEPGELTPMANFEKFVLSRGKFEFWGKDIQYKRVRSMMMDVDVPEIKAKDIAGYDPELDLWFAHNGVVSSAGKDGKVYRADDQGVVVIGKDHYRLSPADKLAIPKLPKFDFDSKKDPYSQVLWPFMDLVADMYGPIAELAVGWMFTMPYAHQFYNLTGGNHPMLFIHGPKGQGKTQFGHMLMRAFGITDKPNPIKNLTITSMYTMVNSFSNIPQWLDEYKPKSFDLNIEEAIKNNYDRTVREVGSLDVFKNKIRRSRTTFMICGEYEPDDHATKSRTVAVGIEPVHNDAKFKEAHRLSHFLSLVVVDMLRRRELYWPHMEQRFHELQAEYRKDFSNVNDSRLVANYAKVNSVLDIIRGGDRDILSRRLERMKKWMESKQEGTVDENPSVQILDKLPYIMKSARVFIPHRIDWRKKVLAVQAKDLLFAYQQSDRTKDSTGKPVAQDIFIRLSRDAKILIPGHCDKAIPSRVTNRTAESGPVSTIQRCFLFDMTNPRVMEVAKELEAHFGKDIGRDANDQAADE